ncbi:hypothetical protein ACN28I_00045 [Archangium gephyra]
MMADELFKSGMGGFWVSSVYMGLPAVLLLEAPCRSGVATR